MKAYEIKNVIVITAVLGLVGLFFLYLSLLVSVTWVYYPERGLEKISISPKDVAGDYQKIFSQSKNKKKKVKLSREQEDYIYKAEKYIKELEEYIAANRGKVDLTKYVTTRRQYKTQLDNFKVQLGLLTKEQVEAANLREYIGQIKPYVEQNKGKYDVSQYEQALEQSEKRLAQLGATAASSTQTNLQIYLPLLFGFGSFIIIIYILRAPLLDFRPFDKRETLHGDAKWATESDIKKSGLRASRGLLLGNSKKGYLINESYQHVLLFAPTGSGKGVGFVIPNLLYWEESCIIHDIKLENYELTSGYRKNKMKQKVYLWNPASPSGLTHCYNPLDFVSQSMGQMVDDCQKICNLLLNEENDFWEKEARSLLLGILLYLCSIKDKKASFGEVVRTLKSDDVIYNLAVVLDTMGGEMHPVGYMNIASFVQKPDKERGSVLSTANSALELWANPIIDAATATSDFDFNTFKKEAVTVYVGLTPDNIDRLQPLMQVFYQQAAQIFTKHMPRPDEKIGVLFLIDEFPTLGEMPIFKQGIAYFRGYKVRLFLVVQDTEQLKDIYEEAGMMSFFANATFRVTFAANTLETAKMISEIIGNKTVKQYSRNSPVFLDLNPASRSKNVSETQRALLLPQEVIGLPSDQQILLIESSPPIRSKKIFYYKDSFFTKRLLPQIDVPTQEPYDPRQEAKKKEEEERRKKEEEEKKKEEERKRKEEQARLETEKRRKEAEKKKKEQMVIEDKSVDDKINSLKNEMNDKKEEFGLFVNPFEAIEEKAKEEPKLKETSVEKQPIKNSFDNKKKDQGKKEENKNVNTKESVENQDDKNNFPFVDQKLPWEEPVANQFAEKDDKDGKKDKEESEEDNDENFPFATPKS